MSGDDGDAGQGRELRVRLGAELRRLRDLSGYSGRQLAARIRSSQSTVSRIEAGDRAPTLPEVAAWCEVTGASSDDTDRLAVLAEAARTVTAPWRTMLDGRLHLQEYARELEEKADTVRYTELTMVPGLLQTAAYARALFPLVLRGASGHDVEAAVDGRMRRQEVLYETGKSFEFLLTETALYAAPTPEVMPAQLAKLDATFAYANVWLGILPFPACTGLLGSFVMYESDDRSLVAVELPHTRLTVDADEDVAAYRDTFAWRRSLAVEGDQARALIQRATEGR